MLHILKVGPVEVGGTTTHVYLPITETGQVGQPVFALDDEAGVREAVGETAREGVACDVTIGAAADALGLLVAAPPQKALEAAAAIALFIAWGQRGLTGLGAELAVRFIHASGALWLARPWMHWDEHQSIPVAVTAPMVHTYEMSVFGNETHGYGLALYQDRGSLERVLTLQENGEFEAAARLPATALMLDASPSFAVAALEAAGFPPRVPLPLKTAERGAVTPDKEDCGVLLAVIAAISRTLVPDGEPELHPNERATILAP